MPRLSVLFLRTSLFWFFVGTTLGALLLVEKATGASPRLFAFLPIHIAVLFFGFLFQFVAGVGRWIFPRFGEKPWKEGLLFVSLFVCNASLLSIFLFLLLGQSPVWAERALHLSLFPAVAYFVDRTRGIPGRSDW